MAMFHVEVSPISRGRGMSIAQRLSYVSGTSLVDCFTGKTYSKERDDVRFCQIYQPSPAPEKFYELQALADALDRAETRKDSRTGRELVCSLPNELHIEDWVEIVEQFIDEDVLCHRLCAVAAIHSGRNAENPQKNNPHAHLIISTRAVSADGFSGWKDRQRDKLEYLVRCREQWAHLQNLAFERNGLEIRLDHRSYREQGIDREPRKHLSRTGWEMEKRGERTLVGDANRAIHERNDERSRQQEIDRLRELEHER